MPQYRNSLKRRVQLVYENQWWEQYRIVVRIIEPYLCNTDCKFGIALGKTSSLRLNYHRLMI